MTVVELPLAAINPFDPSHVADGEGFVCPGEDPAGVHLAGARLCAELISRDVPIRPIAVCAAALVPADRRHGHSHLPWQRLDGFKRYWGHRLAGRETIACVVLDEYQPGAQHGMTMSVD